MDLIRLLISVIGVQLLTLNSYADSFQNHDAIYSAAKTFIQANLAPQVEHEISLSKLDPRLRLIPCDRALEAFTASASLKPGRNAIGVRCASDKSWSLYLSATIKVFENVVILTQALKRGDIINEAQLSVEKKDISQLRPGFINDINAVINQQTTRNLAPGTLLSNRDFSKAIIVRRGDSVIISSNKPYLNIQMQGLAMGDGAQGQSIRIKNTTSGRIITANVIQPGVVSVNF